MPYPLTVSPELDPDDADRVDAAMAAMLGLEDVLDSVPPGTDLPAASIAALVRLVHSAVRDVLLFEPPTPANDR